MMQSILSKLTGRSDPECCGLELSIMLMRAVESKSPAALQLDGVSDSLQIWSNRHQENPSAVARQLQHVFAQLFGHMQVGLVSCFRTCQVTNSSCCFVASRPTILAGACRDYHSMQKYMYRLVIFGRLVMSLNKHRPLNC